MKRTASTSFFGHFPAISPHLLILLFCIATTPTVRGSIATQQEGNTNNVHESVEDPVKQAMAKECRTGYSPLCLKLGLMRLIGRGGGISWPILPGVSITSSGTLPQAVTVSASEMIADPEKVDNILLDRMGDYLGSLSLNVKVMDKKTPMSLAKAFLGDNATARRKNAYGGALAAAGMMSGGTMLALALAALAAMSGKAMMASLLALMLSALAALKGGGGGEKTTYEVIAKPVVSHIATHSSEVQHGHHGHYRRSIDAHNLAYGQQLYYAS